MTPVGDPPNVIIASNRDVKDAVSHVCEIYTSGVGRSDNQPIIIAPIGSRFRYVLVAHERRRGTGVDSGQRANSLHFSRRHSSQVRRAARRTGICKL